MYKFNVTLDESDLLVIMEKKTRNDQIIKQTKAIDFVHAELEAIRSEIKKVINEERIFLTSLKPLDSCVIERLNNKKLLTENICKMLDASRKAGVGPMAAVAGITSEYIGRKIHGKYGEIDVLIENGGDLFVYTNSERYVSIYAGDSVLSNKLRLRITKDYGKIGICTSAGTIGHSLSFGQSDASIIISEDISLADAVATEVGNKVKGEEDIQKAIDYAKNVDGILGVIVIVGESLGAWGRVEFV